VAATDAAKSAVDLDALAINTIRFLAADAVQAANSGHPGLPMGAAAMAYVLWTRHLSHDPGDPGWPDRDRFVLSAGHGSMLLYALLHLTGYDLSLDDIRQFRQWGSRTPGHPEWHHTPGVEATTGPLGQGLADAVGMAIAEAHLAARFNRPGHTVVDHATWVLASDGDLMEGVTAEACSLAGHLQLGKLGVLYDDNRISLAGTTNLSFTEEVAARFRAYGWHVAEVENGNDLAALDAALVAARRTTDRPSLIRVRTCIGQGAPTKANTFEAHGSPLGPDELRAAKAALGWPAEPAFWIPPEALALFRTAQGRGRERRQAWESAFERYAAAHPEPAAELRRRLAGKLPPEWDAGLPTFPADPKGVATRKAGETVLQTLAERLPEIVGGSADLNPSTLTWLKGAGDFEPPTMDHEKVQGRVGGAWGYEGRNLHFGVREHAMGAAVNGMALHGGIISYGATFLVFSDYMRPALRLSALMGIGSIWVYTHDGIGVGEDGPTHQPVEHYAALRAIPGMRFIRPGDANETVEAWRVAIADRHRPTCLAFTRQNIPTLDRARFAPATGLARGAYVLNPDVTKPDIILMATGSEVQYIAAAAEQLSARGTAVRLVSMPCWELFDEQPAGYRDAVLPPTVTARVAIETGTSLGWHRWVGPRGRIIALDRFGASAPGAEVAKRLGFTADHVVASALEVLA
jgi:transketolase